MTRPGVPDDLLRKEADLGDRLASLGSVVIGFSGGVDSSYLAVIARTTLGRDAALAVLGRSPSVPDEQRRHAEQFAATHDVALRVVETGEVADPRYAANPVNRCYFCKSVLWSTLVPLAQELGFAAVADGTNADDLVEHRPGARAALETGVRSPLAESGLTKADIRALSKARGLATWSQPSSPCLASRIPYGTPVTPERLAQVERAEAALRRLGIGGDLRVRHHGDMARVELQPGLIDHWLAPPNRDRLVRAVRESGFARVSLDLRGFRSGSLNVLATVSAG
jgi:uncharacterized protein